MQILFTLLVSTAVSVADVFKVPKYERTALGDNIDVSTMKILLEVYNASTDKNIVSSPLGLMIPLSLYNLGAGPVAKSEITKFLGGTDAKQISESFKELSVMFSEMDSGNLSIANMISVSDKYTLDETFAAAARDYRIEFDKLDFSKPEEAAAKINEWAAEKTNGHITSPVTDDALSPETAAVLFNVIYFNGHWRVPFKAEETQEKDFYTGRGNVVKKPMMHLMNPLYYTESKDLDAKIIELPYKEKGFRMVVVLPNKKDGLSSVLKNTAGQGLLSDVFKLRSAGRAVILYMPKFDVRTKLDLNDILPKVGVSNLFKECATDIVQNVDVKLSKAFQEAFIKVNEEGATAGAFTAIGIDGLRSRRPEPIQFTVDHPFLYTILYEDKIIFAGTYSE